MKDNSKLKAFLTVSRANLLLASIGHATLGILLAAGSINNLYRPEVLIYIFLHYSIAFLACNINCYYDYNVDSRYKTYMSKSVDILGKKLLKKLMAIEIIIACIIIIYFISLGHIITGIAGIIGIIGAIIYSAEPIRIKKRGIISPLPILLLYTLPLIGGWYIFKNHLEISFIIFLFGYILMNEGFTLVNVCEDYIEDKKEHIVTWAHILGLKKTLTFAFIFSICGIFCIIALLINLFYYNTFLNIFGFISIIFSLVLILFASFEVFNIRTEDDLIESVKRYGVNLQRWFIMIRYPLMISAFILLL
jgi:4-hydroxybenzoate polyprenyltransferase